MNIKAIITNYKQQMTSAGLLREAGAAQLSPQVAALRPSLTKVNRAMIENPDLLRSLTQPSPFQILFEYTLPKLEAYLQEIGEAQAKDTIERLCAAGREIMSKYEPDAARECLENLFLDLPDKIEKVKEWGIALYIHAYEDLYFRGKGVEYLNFTLHRFDWDIKDRMIDVKFEQSVSPREMKKIAMIRNIGHLGLFQEEISEEIFASIMRMGGLKELYVRGINDRQMERLTAFKDLRLLILGCSKLSAAGLAHLAALKQLKNLYLEDQVNSNEALSALASLTKVKVLSLAYAQGINDDGIEQIAKMSNLEKLDLEQTGISGRGLKEVAKLTRLKDLNLRAIEITDHDLAELTALTRLKKLDLSCTSIEGPGLAYISQIKSLMELDLAGTKIDDSGLVYLKKMTGLKKLALNGTNLSEAGIAELKQVLPGTNIYSGV